MKIVLIGAGSAQFGLGTLGDLFQSQALEGSEIDIVDIDEKALAHVQKIATSFLEESGKPFWVQAYTDRKEALRDADVVVISIEVGKRFPLWNQDWTIPQQYGIHQVYGENGGAGGVFHSLRITPVIVEICDDVMQFCPNAYVFNYSNPMTAITTAVLRKYPQLKFIGMCHEIASLKRYVPIILDTPYEDIALRAAGLNHFSVLLEASYRSTGKDAYPDILERAPAFFEREPGYSDLLSYVQKGGSVEQTEGSDRRSLLAGTRSSKSWADRTLFKTILERYRLLPITGDSHIGEYISWAWEIADHKGIKDFYEFYQIMLSRNEPKIGTETHERLVYILEALLKGAASYEEPAVNILNEDLIPELPSWIAVEVPGIVSASGIKGVKFPAYPKGFAALLRNYCGVYDLIAEAVLTSRKEYVIQALMANPVVDQCRCLPELVDIMIDRQKPWLDYLG
ncbi:family 4 glycosyl hydrolase [Sediminispirochaeta smaragdinae]|uniref:Glycoside hydrolase family 4 n=1 Tax=Sediminispirochaeta smaragdinae (strain DSM 11293 / JCM 15392 / SEBR 4228) TaxID=573413 RepID=E1R3U1_SEDSS|nr:alpha-glucosidase [Sediminispirochaeta smaragdinae]ADK82062.1 glycoside hydrolase family 4 [Sediminispirochaeta smaragdinae DSM 11293]